MMPSKFMADRVARQFIGRDIARIAVLDGIADELHDLPGVNRARVDSYNENGPNVTGQIHVFAAVPKREDMNSTDKITPGRIASVIKATVGRMAKASGGKIVVDSVTTPLQDFGPVQPDHVHEDVWSGRKYPRVSSFAIAEFYAKHPFRVNVTIY